MGVLLAAGVLADSVVSVVLELLELIGLIALSVLSMLSVASGRFSSASLRASSSCEGKWALSPRCRPPRTMARFTQALPPWTVTASMSTSLSLLVSMACWCSTLLSAPIWSRTSAACSNASCSEKASMRCSRACSTVLVWPSRKALAWATSRA